MEIEKKYLVNTKINDISLENYRKTKIQQYYISLNPEIRLRYKTVNKKSTCFITLKSEGDLIREEVEINIPMKVFTIFKDKAIGRIIKKTRYEIALESGYIAELDIYDGELAGLKVVEVEFSTVDESNKFKKNIPFWFDQEITYDSRYKNKNLALEDAMQCD